jgi:hypothetical protein
MRNVRLFGHAKVRGGRAILAANRTEASREILRAKDALRMTIPRDIKLFHVRAVSGNN